MRIATVDNLWNGKGESGTRQDFGVGVRNGSIRSVGKGNGSKGGKKRKHAVEDVLNGLNMWSATTLSHPEY